MWKHVAQSVVGSGHLDHGLPCQDACSVKEGPLGSDLIFAVSDGAGSASHSEAAAKLSVELLMEEISSARGGPEDDTLTWIRDVYRKIRLRLAQEAEKCAVAEREFSCTLLGGYLSERMSWVCQVGDGAIVVSDAIGYVPITWPSSGEYANLTTFVTSPDWEDVFQFKSLPSLPRAVAAFTDGLQDLILLNADRTVHGGFFDPLFGRLREAQDAATLAEPLAHFLSSRAILERTDDDKTLVLICRRENSPDTFYQDRPTD